MYELECLFNKYFALDSDIKTLGDSIKELLKIKDFVIKSEIKRDAPDGYYKISDDEILIMEHFCFDSTTKRNGSESLAELARINRENNAHDVIKCTISMTNYWKNLKENFTRHYSKINKYKSNLIEEGIANQNTKFKVAFFIEDVTPLGNMDINSRRRIYAIFCDKFIDLFENSPNVDYVFDFSEYGSDKNILFSTRNDIEALRSNEIKIEEIKLVPWEPQVRSFTIKIPN